MNWELCDDDSNDDLEVEVVSVNRNADSTNQQMNNYGLACGEFRRDGEKRYRCRVCSTT